MPHPLATGPLLLVPSLYERREVLATILVSSWPLPPSPSPQAPPITISSLSPPSPQVQELQPSSAVSLIDTDMEAQVVPSLECEQVWTRVYNGG